MTVAATAAATAATDKAEFESKSHQDRGYRVCFCVCHATAPHLIYVVASAQQEPFYEANWQHNAAPCGVSGGGGCDVVVVVVVVEGGVWSGNAC